MARIIVGADTETVDPFLKTRGWSWKYGRGRILATALYYEDGDELKVVAGLHNDNSGISMKERAEGNSEVEALLRNPDVCLVGANIMYDLGFWLYEYGMATYDVRCSLVDVLQAEAILDEFQIHSLESVSRKYLGYGKNTTEVEGWVHGNIPNAKGDFRKYLEDVPYGMLEDYVRIDAKNPVKVWRKQLTELKAQDLCRRCRLEFDCILPTLQMTITGMPFDNGMRKRNGEELVMIRDRLKAEFERKYNVKNFNVNSSRCVAQLCQAQGIPYKCKITLKGCDGVKFTGYEDMDKACAKAKRLVSAFRFVKSVPVAYVPSELADRTCRLLSEEGFMFNVSPNIDKAFYAGAREHHEVIATIADWKLANGILSKILGDTFERFICPDGRIRPQFKVTDTVSFRYSCNKPNTQQFPSKNGLKTEGGEFKFSDKVRSLIHGDSGSVFGKIDYGQIEYRLICNIACGESGEEVRRQYRENPHLDFHQYVVDLTGLSRKYAKNMSFGVSFGMGLASMAESFGWTRERAEEISEQYHQHMPFVSPTLALVGDVAVKRGYIRTAYGSHARLPNPNKKYTMLNRYTQGSGAECLKLSIVKAYREGLWSLLKPSNTVHDELNFPDLAPTAECMRGFYRMAEIMRTALPLNVPLEAEIELGTSWADTQEVGAWLEVRDKDRDRWEGLPDSLRKAVEICEGILKEGKDAHIAL